MQKKQTEPVNFYWVAVLRMVKEKPWINKSRLAMNLCQHNTVEQMIDKDLLEIHFKDDKNHSQITITEDGERLLSLYEEIIDLAMVEDMSYEIMRKLDKHYEDHVKYIREARTLCKKVGSTEDLSGEVYSLKGIYSYDSDGQDTG